MGIFDSGSTSSDFNETTQGDFGTSLGGGILNAIFGVDQRLAGGRFVAGEAAPFVPLSESEAKSRLKAMGIVSPSPREISEFNSRLKAQHEATQGEPFGGFDGFGSSIIGDLTGGGLGVEGQALFDIISQQGQPIDVSALVDQNFTQLKEEFSGFGGLFGSDLQAAALDDRNQLGLQAQQDARQRQLQALGLAQSFNPFGFDTFGTRGGRELELFKNFFQPQSTNQFAGGQNSFGAGSTQQNNGLAGAIGDLAGTAFQPIKLF